VFLTTIAKASPPCVVAALDELPQVQPTVHSSVLLEGAHTRHQGGGGDAQPQLLGLSPQRTLSDHIWLSAPSLPRAPCSCPPLLGYLQEKGYSVLIKIAFQRMTLMCDATLSPDHLRLRISMLGQFG
jgi:hypothetical protein